MVGHQHKNSNNTTVASLKFLVARLQLIFLLGVFFICDDDCGFVTAADALKGGVVHSHKTAASAASWQSKNPNTNIAKNDIQRRYEDFPPTVFAPGGRLFAVERVMKTLSSSKDPASNLVVALKCQDGMVIVSTLPSHPHMYKGSANDDDAFWKPLELVKSSEPFFPLAIGAGFPSVSMGVTAGNAVHSQLLRQKIQNLADSMWENYDDGSGLAEQRLLNPAQPLSLRILARKLADHLQIPTQTVGSRAGQMLVSSALMVDTKEIWQVDATGQFWECHAACIGLNSPLAQVHLLQQCVQGQTLESITSVQLEAGLNQLDLREALVLACQCIQKATFDDTKSKTLLTSEDDSTPKYPPMLAVTFGRGPHDKPQWYDDKALEQILIPQERG